MERENSLRHILHLAYDKNSAKQEERTDNSYDIDKSRTMSLIITISIMKYWMDYIAL